MNENFVSHFQCHFTISVSSGHINLLRKRSIAAWVERKYGNAFINSACYNLKGTDRL